MAFRIDEAAVCAAFPIRRSSDGVGFPAETNPQSFAEGGCDDRFAVSGGCIRFEIG
jgi:hypothetical protein